MRISDWSSDVCSSDLGAVVLAAAQTQRAVRRARLDRTDAADQRRPQRAGAAAAIYQPRADGAVVRALPPHTTFAAGQRALALWLMSAAGVFDGVLVVAIVRSEDRREGKGGCTTGSLWLSPYHYKKK